MEYHKCEQFSQRQAELRNVCRTVDVPRVSHSLYPTTVPRWKVTARRNTVHGDPFCKSGLAQRKAKITELRPSSQSHLEPSELLVHYRNRRPLLF